MVDKLVLISNYSEKKEVNFFNCNSDFELSFLSNFVKTTKNHYTILLNNATKKWMYTVDLKKRKVYNIKYSKQAYFSRRAIPARRIAFS